MPITPTSSSRPIQSSASDHNVRCSELPLESAGNRQRSEEPSPSTQLRMQADFRSSECIYLELLPSLTRMAQELVPQNFVSEVQNLWTPNAQARFLNLLCKITPPFSSSLLALMSKEIQNKLVDRTIKLPTGVNQFIAASRLLKAGTCFDVAQRNKLFNIRGKYTYGKVLVNEIKDRATSQSVRAPHRYEDYLSYQIRELAAATLNQPIDSELLQLLSSTALKFNDSYSKWLAYSGVCDAMPRLSKDRQEHLFYSTIELGKEELQHSKDMAWIAIDLFICMVQKSEGLETEKLKTLIAFIVDYKGTDRYSLLYSLVETARQNEPLRSVVIHAMEKSKNSDALIGLVLDVIRIDQLSEEKRQQLVRDILKIKDNSEKSHILFLLSDRIEALPLNIHNDYLDAILSIPHKLIKSKALCKVAIGIVHLSTENRNRLLNAIQTIDFLSAEAVAAAAYSLGLLQPQAASSSNPETASFKLPYLPFPRSQTRPT